MSGDSLYNYFRDYDPGIGRYVESDPIGVLFGGNSAPREGRLNQLYSYVGSNPLRYFDFAGLEPWDWNGQGDTAVCKYYDALAKKNPSCGYFKEAARICRGQRGDVNLLIDAGMGYSWATGSLNDSQATVLNNVRQTLISEDMAVRQQGLIDKKGCTCGDEVDRYHRFAFDFAGLPQWSYGGNFVPQGRGPNPVPRDPRNK